MKKGWEMKRLGELCEVIAGQSPDGTFYNTSGNGLPFYQGKKEFGEKLLGPPTTWTTVSKKIALDGDILMSVRAPVGPVNFAVDQICIGRGLAAIRSGPYINRDFLFYQLLYLQPEISGTEGAVFASISKSAIETLPLAFPPLHEQHNIVAKLDEAFDGIEAARANTEQNLKNARAIFESEINATFTKCEAVWEKKRLADIVTRLTNGFVGPTRDIYHDSGIPYLLARHVRDNQLAFDGKTFVSESFNQKNKKSILKSGDVLLVQSGHIGHSAVVTAEHDGHNCHAMIVITACQEILTGAFLSLYFNSAQMRRSFDQIRSGSTVPHLTCKEVREIMIPLPDIATQNRYVEQAWELQIEIYQLESTYQRKLSELESLKKSLLHYAFTGNL